MNSEETALQSHACAALCTCFWAEKYIHMDKTTVQQIQRLTCQVHVLRCVSTSVSPSAEGEGLRTALDAESWSHFTWKRLLASSSSIVHLALPSLPLKQRVPTVRCLYSCGVQQGRGMQQATSVPCMIANPLRSVGRVDL